MIANAPHSGAASRPQAQWVVSRAVTLSPAQAMYPAVLHWWGPFLYGMDNYFLFQVCGRCGAVDKSCLGVPTSGMDTRNRPEGQHNRERMTLRTHDPADFVSCHQPGTPGSWRPGMSGST